MTIVRCKRRTKFSFILLLFFEKKRFLMYLKTHYNGKKERKTSKSTQWKRCVHPMTKRTLEDTWLTLDYLNICLVCTPYALWTNFIMFIVTKCYLFSYLCVSWMERFLFFYTYLDTYNLNLFICLFICIQFLFKFQSSVFVYLCEKDVFLEQMRSMGSCLKKSSTIEWSDLRHLEDKCS